MYFKYLTNLTNQFEVIMSNLDERIKELIREFKAPYDYNDASLGFKAACLELADIGLPAVPALIEALKHKVSDVKSNAAKALGLIGPAAKDAIPNLIVNLHDKNDEVREFSVIAIGEIGPSAKDAVPALIEAFLNDEDSWIRSEAKEALGYIGPAAKEAIPALNKLLDDENPDVREAAKEAIKKIES